MTCGNQDELIKAKIYSLLHDPPNKILFMPNNIFFKKFSLKTTMFIKRLYVDSCNDKRRYDENKQKCRYKERKHEKLARCLIHKILSGFEEDLWLRAKESDHMASSYDRILIDRYLENIYGAIYRNPYKKRRPLLLSPVSDRLVNIFEPLIYSSPIRQTICDQYNPCKAYYHLRTFIERLMMLTDRWRNHGLYEYYHLLYVLLEPLWHDMTKGLYWSPADTRVPHHSLFDHLYASAMAANLVANKNGDLDGFMVYVGLAGLHEWIYASRKLSDMWVASWLASAIVWYAVKDLVWRLGPDILVIPSARWNHFYIAMLEEKNVIGQGYGLHDPMDIIRGYYMYREFPYHAWVPAQAVLVLPREIPVGSGGELADARRIEEYLRERIREAWSHIVKAIKEQLDFTRAKSVVDKRKDCENIVSDIERALDEIMDRPPFTPIVVVEEIRWRNSKGEEDTARICRKVFSSELCSNYIELVEYAEEKVSKCVKEYVRKDLLRKLTYVTAFYRLMTRASVARKQAPRTPGVEYTYREEHPGRWRTCTVCGRLPSVLRVKGREKPGRGRIEFDNEYSEWAECISRLLPGETPMDKAALVIRPVFRPGERLCPYCLVKRLAGLPSIFSAVAEKLIGKKPPRRILFPSTDDVAGLATKMAMARLARRILTRDDEAYARVRSILAGENGIAGMLDKLPLRSKELRELADKLREFYQERGKRGEAEFREELGKALRNVLRKHMWSPWLLDREMQRLYRYIRIHGSEISVENLAAAALLVLMASVELYSLIGRWGVPGARKLLMRIGEALEETRRRGDAEAKAIAEALMKPRIYYIIVRFDADKIGHTLLGLLSDEDGKLIPAPLYARRMIMSMRNILGKVSSGGKILREIERSLQFLYIHLVGSKRACTPSSLVAENAASLLVTPSYHVAVSHALSYTLIRSAIVARRLGGVPVYMAGDEGLVLLPAWLPPVFTRTRMDDKGSAEKYAESLRGLLGDAGELAGHIPYSAPGLLYAAVLRRLFWGASSSSPGFHPVKKHGRGKVVYRIPALVSNGLSMSVRIAHYRDHLGSELWAAEGLLGKAKSYSRGGGCSGDGVLRCTGDATAISYGRVPPLLTRHEPPNTVVLPNTPTMLSGVEKIRDTGYLHAVLLALTGTVAASRDVSRSLLCDGIWFTGELGEAAQGLPGLDPVYAVIHHVVKRNTRDTAKETRERLEKLLGHAARLYGGDAAEAAGLLEQLFRSAEMIYAAMTRSYGE